jgi:hypothetical protein
MLPSNLYRKVKQCEKRIHAYGLLGNADRLGLGGPALVLSHGKLHGMRMLQHIMVWLTTWMGR